VQYLRPSRAQVPRGRNLGSESELNMEGRRPESTYLVRLARAHDLLADLETYVMGTYELQQPGTGLVSDEFEGSCRPHLPVACRVVGRRGEQARHELEGGDTVNDPPREWELKVRKSCAVMHLERLGSA
jgi:hypothetical protein